MMLTLHLLTLLWPVLPLARPSHGLLPHSSEEHPPYAQPHVTSQCFIPGLAPQQLKRTHQINLYWRCSEIFNQSIYPLFLFVICFITNGFLCVWFLFCFRCFFVFRFRDGVYTYLIFLGHSRPMNCAIFKFGNTITMRGYTRPHLCKHVFFWPLRCFFGITE